MRAKLFWILLAFMCLTAMAADTIPAQYTDAEFWRMVTDLSEPAGQYSGDNWISNEPTIQDVIPPLKQVVKPGGVYIGVGPEQNFTYMWALQSKIGFIVDIRRQNMLDILLFKALFEMSPDRATFVSNLFSRKRRPPQRISFRRGMNWPKSWRLRPPRASGRSAG